MPKYYPSIPPDLQEWLLKQPIFFVASAPTHGAHVNVSPKGLASSTFAVINPNQVAYLDRTGSGCETLAHIYENGRVTVMFNSFGAAPRIMRLFCRGRVIEWDTAEFPVWLAKMGQARPAGVRSIIVLDVFKTQTSCGFGVPRVRRELYDHEVGDGDAEAERGKQTDKEMKEVKEDLRWANELAVFEERPTLELFASKQEKAGTTLDYQVQKNLISLDGLPGLRAARRKAGRWLCLEETRTSARRIAHERGAVATGFALAVLLYVMLLSVGMV